MFKVNDYIMYGMTGVCQVVDITKESFIDNLQKEYYVLKYIYSNDTIIKIPTDNKKVPMRKILSKGEVTTLINSMPNSETIWIDDDRKRNEEFKSILKTGDIENLVKLTPCATEIKSLSSSSFTFFTMAPTSSFCLILVILSI